MLRVARKYLFTLRIVLKDRSEVAADAAGHCQEDANNCDHVGIKVWISVLECTVSVSVTDFLSVE